MNKRPTILHVDDHPDDLWLFSIAFEKSAIDATLVSLVSTQAAVLYLNRMGEYAHAPIPDRIILDYQMPWMNGKQVIDLIRSTETLRTIPIVLLTGGDTDSLARGSLGVDLIISKPNTIESLITLMPKILGSLAGTTSRVQRMQRTRWSDSRLPDGNQGKGT